MVKSLYDDQDLAQLISRLEAGRIQYDYLFMTWRCKGRNNDSFVTCCTKVIVFLCEPSPLRGVGLIQHGGATEILSGRMDVSTELESLAEIVPDRVRLRVPPAPRTDGTERAPCLIAIFEKVLE